MRRVNQDRRHPDSYEWFRYQESKPLSVALVFLFISLFIPLLPFITISALQHGFLILLFLFTLRHCLTKVSIANECDGLYLEINNTKHRKLADWEDPTVHFTKRKADSGNCFVVMKQHGTDEDPVYESCCEKIDDFFNTASNELIELHSRNKNKD